MKNLIETRLEKLIPEPLGEHAILFESARYALLGGGKRLRPALTLAVLDSYGFKEGYGIEAACALEMIHTYSLIHDDLPCMDDDDLRRGKPSLHKKYGEAIALLTGDYLLTRSFEILSHMKEFSFELRNALISTLAKAAGGFGMIGGQVMDMESDEKASLKKLQLLHQKKTGALIQAAIHFGAILAKASDKDQNILNLFGEYLGTAFQIIDDVLDATESSEMIGKNALSDFENGKTTYVTLLGVEKSVQEAKRLYAKAVQLLDELSVRAPKLQTLADAIIFRRS